MQQEMQTGKHCVTCGTAIHARAEICPSCGVRQPIAVTPMAYGTDKSKIAAGLLAIFLGGLGIHKFYLGQTGQGVLYLVLSLVSAVLWFVLIGIFFTAIICTVAFIEGIIYLTMSDAAFAAKYGYRQGIA